MDWREVAMSIDEFIGIDGAWMPFVVLAGFCIGYFPICAVWLLYRRRMKTGTKT